MRWKVALIALWVGASCSRSAEDASPTLARIAAGKVRVLDLSYPLNRSNPHWPGENYTPFRMEALATIEEDGVYSAAFCAPEHLGTHLDAPNHFEKDQPSVDQIELAQLVAPLVVVDIRKACQADPDYELSLRDLQSWGAGNGPIDRGSVVAAWTGWGRHWENLGRYQNLDTKGKLHFPGFSVEAARFLIQEKGVKGIAIDTLSVDRGLSTDFGVHRLVNGEGGYHLENVANLSQLPRRGAWLIAAPIKLQGGSGGPARLWGVF